VVVRDPPGPMGEIPIDAYCVVCGFKLGWKVVLGNMGLEREAREQERGLYRLLESSVFCIDQCYVGLFSPATFNNHLDGQSLFG